MQDIAMVGGDLLISEFGDLALTATENDDIIQTANNNISTILGENQFHEDIGNDIYNRRIKLSLSGLIQIANDCKDAILNGDDRVNDVTYINATRGDTYGQCYVDYILLTEDGDTVDGRVSINIC